MVCYGISGVVNSNLLLNIFGRVKSNAPINVNFAGRGKGGGGSAGKLRGFDA